MATPILTYGSESWACTEKQKRKLEVMEMRFLRKIDGKTRMDKIRNEKFREKLSSKPIREVVEESQLRWFGHVKRMGEERITRRIYEARPGVRRKKGRPRKEWQNEVIEAVKNRGKDWREATRLTQDRKRWRQFWKKMNPE